MTSATTMLAVLTTHIHDEAFKIKEAAESVRVSEELSSTLNDFHRLNAMIFMKRSRMSIPSRAVLRNLLHEKISEAREHSASPEEQKLVSQIEKAINRYLSTIQKAQSASRNLSEWQLLVTPSLDDAQLAVDQLVSFNVKRARISEADAASWSKWADQWSLILGIVALIGVFSTLTGLHFGLYKPLLNIYSNIVRFANGEKTARSKESGIRELRAIAHELNSLAEKATRDEQDRLAFLGGVAHDLRNPLTAIRLPLQLLAVEKTPIPVERLRERLKHMDLQIDRLERMVGDFLDATRIEAGQLELRMELHDVRDLLKKAVDYYSTISPKHNFKKSIPDHPIAILCDPMRIEQVLNNLVSNAVKYSPRGGDISLTIEETAESISITVADQGIGMTQEDLAQIFQPFKRTPESKELVPGVGLGLTISKKIVAAHGGFIKVQSRRDFGSSFTVTLPRESYQQQAA